MLPIRQIHSKRFTIVARRSACIVPSRKRPVSGHSTEDASHARFCRVHAVQLLMTCNARNVSTVQPDHRGIFMCKRKALPTNGSTGIKRCLSYKVFAGPPKAWNMDESFFFNPTKEGALSNVCRGTGLVPWPFDKSGPASGGIHLMNRIGAHTYS
jgi:hypothetical protein